ncbi:MAG: AraC family transcriptional regulator [Myxococcota bacterium]
MTNGRTDYIARVQRVQDHIEQHLAEPLELVDLAKVAHFSPFHFHRIFTALVGETPSAFVRRVRLERAASVLLTLPEYSITEIAIDCGFGETSSFSRAFRRHFGMSAREWRKNGHVNRKHGQVEEGAVAVSSNHQEVSMKPEALAPTGHDVQERDAFTVAYVRHTGPYAGDGSLFGRLFGQLTGWLSARDLMSPTTRMLTIYHDDPGVTDDSQLRISVCASVPTGTEGQGEVGVLEVPAGKCLVATFELTTAQYASAWQWVYGNWLPDSPYEPDDRFGYEEYLGMPDDKGIHRVALIIPVRPRRG